MAACIHCTGDRVARTCTKAVEITIFLGEAEHVGPVPSDMGLGEGGDYVELTWCLDCGSMQLPHPLPKCAMEPRAPRKAGRRADGPLPDVVDMEARFPGLCRCGARFVKGSPISYSRIAGEVLRCKSCFVAKAVA